MIIRDKNIKVKPKKKRISFKVVIGIIVIVIIILIVLYEFRLTLLYKISGYEIAIPTKISPQYSSLIAKLPPNPGIAGKKTILGIDSDGDGVRDDIQIAVTKLIPDDPYKRAALMCYFAMENELWKAYLDYPNQTIEYYYPYYFGIILGNTEYMRKSDASDVIPYNKLAALLYNTSKRIDLMLKIGEMINGEKIMSLYENNPEYKEKTKEYRKEYEKKFQEFYEREMERQK
jgi:hypothetical protein